MMRVTAAESALESALESAIESALEYAENIIGTVREPLVVLDAELKILTVNDSFYRTFKVTPAETIGNFIFDLGNRQWDIPRLRVLLEEILPQNNICNDYEVDHVFQNIGHRTVLFNARQIFRKDLGSHITLLAMEDITDQKSTMAQLLHSQKQESIGQLAGGLAHDLNNILSVINGYATLTRLDMNKDTKQFNYLNEVITASSRAASLTSSLLTYSRKQEMNQHNQNLNALITTVGSFISRVIHDNIEFTLSLHDDPLVAYVDTVQIEQVLLNLATNARDAMPLGGTFTIATVAGDMDETFIATHGYGKVGRYAIITVTDNGHGMDNQTKRKAFSPFFTTKEVGKGTGLGLSMVMGIIKQHGGFIDLQSEPGSGSVFRLYLPLTDTGAVAAAPAEENLPLDKGLGTILVAEDDPATLSVLEAFLKMAGYTVITAIDGQDAVEKFAARRGEIDLVISDVIMPRKSGKAASDEIRGMSDTVKFIFVSGHSDHVIEREGYFDTDTEIVIKPILPFELLKKMRDILEN